MPEYKFRNKETGEEHLESMKISELDQYKADHPELEQMVHGAPLFVCPIRLGVQKPSTDFRNRLREIKNTHKHSTINPYDRTEI